MMERTGNETLDRIQREIQEALQREEELRQKYNLISNNNNNNENGDIPNGFKTPSPEPQLPPRTTNGIDAPKTPPRAYTPNPSSRGVMQKFLKMHGKLNLVTMKPKVEPQVAWIPDIPLEPAKVTIEAGKPIRNGFVSAEEKMRRELQEFQRREAELRLERQKSQPDLMAALAREEEEKAEKLKPARSVAALYTSEDSEDGSGHGSLKATRSLAELCEASDDELETRRTHSLIRQFENLKSQA